MISVEQAREMYTARDATHDFDHVLRVTEMAVRIAVEEGANVEVVRTAALLHDIGLDNGRVGHEHTSAEQARRILAGHPPEKVEAVALAILSHRFRSGPPPQTLEARCLFDADKLDAIGAIGVARVFAFAGSTGQRLWAHVPPDYVPSEGNEHTAVHEYVWKLAQIRQRLLTRVGQRIGQERHDYMVAFFERLEREAKGEA